MKRTGEMLQKAREEKGLSLNEIALSLKINSKVLSAIESGDTSKLPAKTFLRGFVQSYANYLKINTDQVMEVFSEEMGLTRPVTSADASAVSPEGAVHHETTAPIAHREEPVLSQIEKRNNTKLFVITGVCLVLVCLIFVTARIVDRYQKETITEEVQVASPLPDDSAPESEQTAASDDEAETTPTPVVATPPAPNPTAATPTTPPAPTTPPVASTPTTPPVAKPTPPPATPATPPAPASPKPVETKPAPPAATTAAAPATTPAPAEPAKPTEPEKKPAGRALEMIVESLDNVEIEYGSSSGPLRKVQLGPDRVHTIRSREGLRLNISNGGAVNLNLNGRDLGVPGDLGKPVKLSY